MPGVAKVQYFGETLIDISGDTVTAAHLESGYTAHNKAGDLVNGSLVVQRYYTGSGTPSNSLGNNGDIYLMG